jgi:RimJ/RimL family protein N-acetyltransferase
MTDIPRLRTERLVLRGFEERDFETYAAMMADPDVVRYLGDGRPLSRADAWRQLAMFAGHWVLRGFGLWAVENATTGSFLGRIGCLEPEGWPGFEIGYALARDAWGKGYAREGAARALAYARKELGRTDIISLIRPANAGSIKVARALGAVAAETVELFGAPTIVYRYPGRDEHGDASRTIGDSMINLDRLQ